MSLFNVFSRYSMVWDPFDFSGQMAFEHNTSVRQCADCTQAEGLKEMQKHHLYIRWCIRNYARAYHHGVHQRVFLFLNYTGDMILQVWIRKGHIVTNRLAEEQKVLRLEVQWNNCVWQTQQIITNVLTYNCYFSFLLKSFLLPLLLFGRVHIQKKAISPVCDTTINKDKQTNKQTDKQTKEKWFSKTCYFRSILFRWSTSTE